MVFWPVASWQATGHEDDVCHSEDARVDEHGQRGVLASLWNQSGRARRLLGETVPGRVANRRPWFSPLFHCAGEARERQTNRIFSDSLSEGEKLWLSVMEPRLPRYRISRLVMLLLRCHGATPLYLAIAEPA